MRIRKLIEGLRYEGNSGSLVQPLAYCRITLKLYRTAQRLDLIHEHLQGRRFFQAVWKHLFSAELQLRMADAFVSHTQLEIRLEQFVTLVFSLYPSEESGSVSPS